MKIESSYKDSGNSPKKKTMTSLAFHRLADSANWVFHRSAIVWQILPTCYLLLDILDIRIIAYINITILNSILIIIKLSSNICFAIFLYPPSRLIISLLFIAQPFLIFASLHT